MTNVCCCEEQNQSEELRVYDWALLDNTDKIPKDKLPNDVYTKDEINTIIGPIGPVSVKSYVDGKIATINPQAPIEFPEITIIDGYWYINGLKAAKVTGDQGTQGPRGEKGETGAQGPQGNAGESAYEIAKDNGFIGTEAQWLESLTPKISIDSEGYWCINGENTGVKAKGEKGSPGASGESGTTIEIINDHWVINGRDYGPIRGAEGRGIRSISKTGEEDDWTDIYTITYTDNTFDTFKVINGKNGEKGEKGEDGKNGLDGLNGSNGVNGAPGTNTYFHVAYANKNSHGDIIDFSTTDPTLPGGIYKEYIGTYVDNKKEDELEDYNVYTWMLIRGALGERGIPGESGRDGDDGLPGKTQYLHIKYSNDGGKTFTDNNGETPGYYLGLYVSFDEYDIADVRLYKWSLIKGADGNDGKDGIGINVKGSVNSESELPQSGNEAGDAYLVGEYIFVWTGTTWKNMGRIAGGVSGGSQYLHIAYANSDDGSIDFSVIDDKSSGIIHNYLGICVNDEVEDPGYDRRSEYTWTLIRGAQGDPGADGTTFEFIYTRNNGDELGNPNPPTKPFYDSSHRPVKEQDDWYGEDSAGITWTDNPQGVQKDIMYEYVSTRAKKNNMWSDFSTPVVWSSWGKDGLDGDGFEYIYTVTTESLDNPTSPTPDNWRDSSSVYQTVNEFVNYIPLELSNYSWTWTDDPQQLTSTNKYQWVSVRKRTNGVWDLFSTPVIWSKWSEKGTDGRGILSVTEYYLATPLNSGITRNSSGWSRSVQTINSTNKYLWNYEQINYTEGDPTYTDPAIIGAFGEDGNDGRGISSITEYYLASPYNAGITRSTSGWTTTVQTVTSTNKYLWNYEKIEYTSGNPTYTTPAIIGVYGDKGDGITNLKEYYLVSPDSSGITNTSGNWSTSIPTMDKTNKYLWNYEEITYGSNNHILKTDPVIISTYGTQGNDGRGITSITNYYLTSPNSTGITRDTEGWNTAVPTLNATKKYLWNYEKIEYTSGNPTYTEPRVLGVYGDKGDPGDPGSNGLSSFKSICFLRSNQTPSTPTGGNFNSPYPESKFNGKSWQDGIPTGEEKLWATSCIFTSDGQSPLLSVWTTPRLMTDTDTLDIEFSPRETLPNAPTGSTPYSNHESEGWYDPNSLNFNTAGTMIWRAERKVSNGVYDGDWVITRVYGEKGDPGEGGGDISETIEYIFNQLKSDSPYHIVSINEYEWDSVKGTLTRKYGVESTEPNSKFTKMDGEHYEVFDGNGFFTVIKCDPIKNMFGHYKVLMGGKDITSLVVQYVAKNTDDLTYFDYFSSWPYALIDVINETTLYAASPSYITPYHTLGYSTKSHIIESTAFSSLTWKNSISEISSNTGYLFSKKTTTILIRNSEHSGEYNIITYSCEKYLGSNTTESTEVKYYITDFKDSYPYSIVDYSSFGSIYEYSNYPYLPEYSSKYTSGYNEIYYDDETIKTVGASFGKVIWKKVTKTISIPDFVDNLTIESYSLIPNSKLPTNSYDKLYIWIPSVTDNTIIITDKIENCDNYEVVPDNLGNIEVTDDVLKPGLSVKIIRVGETVDADILNFSGHIYNWARESRHVDFLTVDNNTEKEETESVGAGLYKYYPHPLFTGIMSRTEPIPIYGRYIYSGSGNDSFSGPDDYAYMHFGDIYVLPKNSDYITNLKFDEITTSVGLNVYPSFAAKWLFGIDYYTLPTIDEKIIEYTFNVPQKYSNIIEIDSSSGKILAKSKGSAIVNGTLKYKFVNEDGSLGRNLLTLNFLINVRVTDKLFLTNGVDLTVIYAIDIFGLPILRSNTTGPVLLGNASDNRLDRDYLNLHMTFSDNWIRNDLSYSFSYAGEFGDMYFWILNYTDNKTISDGYPLSSFKEALNYYNNLDYIHVYIDEENKQHDNLYKGTENNPLKQDLSGQYYREGEIILNALDGSKLTIVVRLYATLGCYKYKKDPKNELSWYYTHYPSEVFNGKSVQILGNWNLDENFEMSRTWPLTIVIPDDCNAYALVFPKSNPGIIGAKKSIIGIPLSGYNSKTLSESI